MKPALQNILGLCLVVLTALAGTPPAHADATAPIEAATYNLRLNLASDGPNAWTHRRAMVESLVRYHQLDLIGTQEGLIDQIRDLEQMPEYARVGRGRDDGQDAGEHSAIFYRRARFELLASGDFWLSATPDRPSMGWDARCCKRIASWARLRDKASGRSLAVFSVHFDHEGVVARRESAALMLRQMAELSQGLPIVCLGDFNSTPDTPQIAAMSAALHDARTWSQTPPYGPVGTFNGFKLDAPMDQRIDYIFVSPAMRVLKYAVLSDHLDGRFPSDHHPVVARLLLD